MNDGASAPPPAPAATNPNVDQPAPEPPATLQEIRGADYPSPGGDPNLTVQYLERLWKEGETEAIQRYRQATHNILYMNGRQWIDWVKTKRTWEDLPLSDGEVRVTMNEVRPILNARLERMLPDSLGWVAHPRRNSYEVRDRANVAVEVVRHRWTTQRMEQKVSDGLYESYGTGFCALKSFWNPNVGPMQTATKQFCQLPSGALLDPAQVQAAGVDTSQLPIAEHPVDATGAAAADKDNAFQYRPGDSDTALRSLFNIRLNPEAVDWNEAGGLKWLIDSEVLNIHTAREMNPEIAKMIQPNAGSETLVTYERMAQGSNTVKQLGIYSNSPYVGAKVQTPTQEYCIKREYWEMPSSYFPNGRMIQIVGGQMAYDGDWPQGIFPYTPLFDEPGIKSPYGRPTVNDMISPQEVINQQWTAIVSEMKANGVGQFVAWDVPGVADSITTENRAVIKIPVRSSISGKPLSEVFHRLEHAQVPPDRWNMIQEAKASLYNIGAYHEVSRGQIPPGLDSGVAIEHLLESESMQMKRAIKSLKRSLITWAQHQIMICKWGYGENEDRWIPVNSPDLRFSVESVSGTQLPDLDEFDLDLEYFRPSSEAATRSEVKELVGMNMIDPRKAMKILDLGRDFTAAYESQDRHYVRAATENLCFLKGDFQLVAGPPAAPEPGPPSPDGSPTAPVGPPPPPQMIFLHPEDGSPFLLPQDDDHLIHMDVHAEIALDPSKPWPTRQAMLMHIQSHRESLQSMIPAQPAPTPPAMPPQN